MDQPGKIASCTIVISLHYITVCCMIAFFSCSKSRSVRLPFMKSVPFSSAVVCTVCPIRGVELHNSTLERLEPTMNCTPTS